MRKPSGRILRDTVDVYYNTPAQGNDGGFKPTYPTTPSILALPCSVQYEGVEKSYDHQNRITEIRSYKILSSTDPEVGPDDKIMYIDNSGITHTLFVQASNDQAGRGSCWKILATEHI